MDDNLKTKIKYHHIFISSYLDILNMSTQFDLNVYIYDTIFKSRHFGEEDVNLDPVEKDVVIVFAHFLLDSLFPEIEYDAILMGGGTIELDYREFIANIERLSTRFSFRFKNLYELLGISNDIESAVEDKCTNNLVVMIVSCLREIFGLTLHLSGPKIEFNLHRVENQGASISTKYPKSAHDLHRLR